MSEPHLPGEPEAPTLDPAATPRHKPLGPAGRLAAAFINSKLTPLVILASLALGFFAVLITPREEEPQIKVPMIDVLVPFPEGTQCIALGVT